MEGTRAFHSVPGGSSLARWGCRRSSSPVKPGGDPFHSCVPSRFGRATVREPNGCIRGADCLLTAICNPLG